MVHLLRRSAPALLALVLVPATVSGTDTAGGGRPAAGESSADSVPQGSGGGVRGPWAVMGVTATGVTEAAWAAGGPGTLQLLTVGLEPELSQGLGVRLELMGKIGHDGAPFASAQGLSSLDAEDFGGVGEAWLEWRTRGAQGETTGRGLRLKLGRVDANTEFAYSDAAAAFGNPSFGMSPVLAVLPTYPSPATSVNVFARAGATSPEVGSGLYRTADGTYVLVGQLSGEIRGPGTVRWSAGWAGSLAGPEAQAGAYLVVERASDERWSPFLMVSGAGGGRGHVAAGATLPRLPFRLPATVGVGATLLRDPGTADEAVAEVFGTLMPVGWLRLQLHGQLHVADGSRPSAAGLFRVVVEG